MDDDATGDFVNVLEVEAAKVGKEDIEELIAPEPEVDPDFKLSLAPVRAEIPA